MPCCLPREGAPRCYSAIISALIFVILLLFLPWQSFAFSAVSLGDFDNVTVMEVSGNFNALDPYGQPNLEPRRAIAREFYRTHGDDYDFLVIFTNFDFLLPPGAKALFAPARNNVSGIGLPLSDATNRYSANGAVLERLEGTIDMGSSGNHVLEPSDPGFDDTLLALTHEFVHRWGAYVRFLDSGSPSEALLGLGKAHWSLLLDAGGSSLYGSNWLDNGDGTFTSIAPEQAGDGEVLGRFFNPLELYLMGLLDKTRVPPMLLIDTPGFDPAQLPQVGITIPGVARTVTIDDIVAAEGERIPAVSASRKEYRMAFIYAVLPGTWSAGDARDRGEIEAINRLQGEWEKRFSILTGGAAMMHTAFVQPAGADANPILPAFPLAPAGTQGINGGIDWLISRQQSGGYWQDQTGTEQRDTAAAIEALQCVAAGHLAAGSGAAWLAMQIPPNYDFFAHKLLALEHAGAADLLSAQNADGGWGPSSGYASNPGDTALVVQALNNRDAVGSDVLAKAVGYLHAGQNPDGGWDVGHGTSLVQPTARVLLALNALRAGYPVEPDIADGLAWLSARQNGDGGFGPGASTVIDTAFALQAIQTVGGPVTVVTGAVDYLLNRQDASGSWHGSAFQTALAVAALYAGQVRADLTVAAADISFSPASVLTVPLPVTVTVSVRNLGSEAAASVTVALYDGDPATGPPVGEQVVDVPGKSGVPVSFTITATEAGLHEYRIVVDGGNRIAESNEWNNTASRTLAVKMAPPLIGFAASASTGSEAVTAVPLTVALSYPWPEPVTVSYSINAGSTAMPSADYVLADGTLTFAADETSKSISLSVANDLLAEPDKTVIVDLLSPSSGMLGTARHVYTIRDDEPPSITITSPPAGLIGQNAPQLLYATTGGNVVVKVDGGVVAKVSGETLDPLLDGLHSVEVAAVNSFGVSTSARVDFTVDTALPAVTIRSPLPGSTTNARPLLDYTVASAVSLEVLVDAVPVSAMPGHPLGPLSDGMHTLTINAWNAAGAKSTTRVEFRVDGRPPVVSITYPPSDYIRDTAPVLRYRTDEPGLTTIWLDGVETTLAADQVLGHLNAGLHRLQVAVTDAVGNVGSDEVEFAVAGGGEPPFATVGNWPGIVAGSYGGIAADRAGNLCLVTRPGEKELAIAWYDQSGQQIRYAVRPSYFNVAGGIWVDIVPKDIAVDSQGDVYVVGWGEAVSQNLSVLAKYDADGNYVAHVLFDPGWLGADVELSSVDVDPNDQIYVAGKTEISLYSDPKTNATVFVAKFDRLLNRLHGRSFGDPYTDPSSFYFASRDALTVDQEQNVWIAGKDSSNRLMVWKLAPDLSKSGVVIVGPSGTRGLDVDIDLSGHLYVAGSGPSGGAVWKYSPADGQLVAVRDVVSALPLPSLAALGDGTVVVVDEAGIVTKLDRNLDTLWSTSLGGDFDAKLALSPAGQLFVGGSDGIDTVASFTRISDPRHPFFSFDQPYFCSNSDTVLLSGYLDAGFEGRLAGGQSVLLDYQHDVSSGQWQLLAGDVSPGRNQVTVSVANDLGLARHYTTEVVVDTVGPAVTIQQPPDGSNWTEKPWLSYAASEGEVRVYVNGVDVTKASGYRLDSLRAGENRIRVQSVDCAGNIGFDEVVIQATGAAIGEYPLVPADIRPTSVTGDQTVIDTGMDAAGNIYVFGDNLRELPGYTWRDLYVAKYDPFGTLLYSRLIDGNSNDEYGAALAVADNGEFLLAYNTRPPAGGHYISVVRFAADGTLLWRDDMSSGASDVIHDLAIDAAGNIYACGETTGRLNNKKYGGNGDYFLVKYTPQGTRLWTVLSNAATYESLQSIGVSADGFLYGGGWRAGDGFMTLFKFDLNGVMLWRKQSAYPREFLGAERMEVGPDGSIYTFAELKTSLYPYYYYLCRHDRDGNFVAGIYGEGPAIKGGGLALDAEGNVYVTGSSGDPYGLGWSFDGHRSYGGADLFIIKYAAKDLQVIWTAQAGDAGDQAGHSLIFSPVNGQAYLVGAGDGTIAGTQYSGDDIFVAPLLRLPGTPGLALAVADCQTPTRERFQQIRGRVTPGAQVEIGATSPKGAAPTLSPVRYGPDGAWSFVASDLAVDAENVFTVRATDGSAMIAQNVTITVDATPPFLTVDPVVSPTSRSEQTIGGSIEAAATLVVANGQAAIPIVDGRWRYDVGELLAGENIFTFIATDGVGNRTVLPVTINYEPPAPPVLAMTPAQVAADAAVDVVLHVSGISPPGTTVTIVQLLDLDDNGLADAADPIVRRFTVTDGLFNANPNIVSDSDGTPDGSLVVRLNYRVSNDRYHAAGQYLFVAETETGHATGSFRIVEAMQPQSLEGVVQNSEGGAVGGALLELQDPWAVSHGFAVTDRTGRYRFNIREPGDYLPVPSAEGYVYDRGSATTVPVAPGQSVVQDLTMLVGPRQVGGRLVDAISSTGLEGVTVRAESSRYLAVGMTDGDGTVTFRLPDGDYRLSVAGRPGDGLAAHGYIGSTVPSLSVTAGSVTAGMDLPVHPGTSLDCGLVRDANSAGVGGVPVLAVAVDGSGRTAEAYSDEHGRYCLARTPGAPWPLWLDDQFAQGIGVIGTAGTTEQPVLTVYPVNARIAGTVRNAAGQPVAGIAVAAGHAAGASATVATAADGRYRLGISAEPPGDWLLTVADDGAEFAAVPPVAFGVAAGQVLTQDFALVPLRDNTIVVTRAFYDSRKRVLAVEATSSHENAALQIAGYGPMTFSRLLKGKYYWSYSAKIAVKPATVTVSGPEGSKTVAVQ